MNHQLKNVIFNTAKLIIQEMQNCSRRNNDTFILPVGYCSKYIIYKEEIHKTIGTRSVGEGRGKEGGGEGMT